MSVVLRRKGVGGDFFVEERTISAAEAAAEQLTLANTPGNPATVTLNVPTGVIQRNGFDYDVVGANIVWGGFALETILEAGDILIISYFA